MDSGDRIIRIRTTDLAKVRLLAETHDLSLIVEKEIPASKTCRVDSVVIRLVPLAKNGHVVLGYANNKDALMMNFTDNKMFKHDWMDTTDFSRCDACGCHRARNKIFIVQEVETGEIKQLGGSCASNLNLAHKVSKLVDRVTDVLKEFDKNDIDCFHSGKVAFDYSTFIPIWLGCIRTEGFVSSRESGFDNPSTRHICESVFIGSLQGDSASDQKILSLWESKLTEEERNKDWVGFLLKELHNMEWKENDFLINVKNALEFGSSRLAGYVCAFVNTLEKNRIREIEQKKFTEIIETKELPPIDQKIEVDGLIVSAKTDDDAFGCVRKILIQDRRWGKIWFKTTAEWSWGAQAGNEIQCLVTTFKVNDDISFCKRPHKVKLLST